MSRATLLLAATIAGVAAALGCRATLEYPSLEAAAVDEYRNAVGPDILHAYRELRGRLESVAFAVLVGGGPYCGQRLLRITGAVFAGPKSFDDPLLKELGAREFGTGEGVRVIHVAAESPLAHLGARRGDIVVAVGGEPIGEVEPLVRAIVESSGPVRLLLLRGSERFERDVAFPLGCPFTVSFSPSYTLRTRHQGDWRLVIPAGLLRIADDDELGVAVAHELAHALLNPDTSTPLDHEVTADRVGLEIAARAGFDVSVAPEFWTRIATERPWAIEPPGREQAEAHWGIAERLPRIQALSREIGQSPGEEG